MRMFTDINESEAHGDMAKTKKAKKACSALAQKRAATCAASNRLKKLSSWSEESMLGALDTVKSGKLGLDRAALEFGITRTTLKDRVAGRVVHGTRSGPKPYLTPQEEKELAEFLITCSKMG